MRLHTLWTGGLVGFCLSVGAALADVSAGLSTQVLAAYSPYHSSLGGFGGPLAVPVPTPVVPRYERDWIEARPAAQGDAEWECLAKAIYFEARGESIRGQFAVAEVILNRVASPLYPRSVCRVVHQGGSGGCQFSFTCDGYSDRIREKAAYAISGKIARLMLDGAPRLLTDGATHFHTRNVRPRWAHRMPRTATIGHHLFYRAATGG